MRWPIIFPVAIDMDELGTFQRHGDKVDLRYERRFPRPPGHST